MGITKSSIQALSEVYSLSDVGSRCGAGKVFTGVHLCCRGSGCLRMVGASISRIEGLRFHWEARSVRVKSRFVISSSFKACRLRRKSPDACPTSKPASSAKARNLQDTPAKIKTVNSLKSKPDSAGRKGLAALHKKDSACWKNGC